MMIGVLNRFFERHGRKAFAVFTVLIIISFVLYFAPGVDFFGMMGKGGKPRAAGMALGKAVSVAELRDAASSLSILMCLQYPFASMESGFVREMAESGAMERIILLRAAEERGVSVSDTDLAKFMRSLPIFQKDGKFDGKLFNDFVTAKLAPHQLTKQDLDNAVRDALLVERLSNEVRSPVCASTDEIRAAFNMRNEKFKVKAARFSSDAVRNEVSADDKSVESFFNANPGSYTVPAKSKAKFAKFIYAGYEEKAAKLVTEEGVRKYYDRNKESFKENDAVQPLDKVSGKIRKILSSDIAKDLALKDAAAFAAEAFNAAAELSTSAEIRARFISFSGEKNVRLFDTQLLSALDSVVQNAGKEPVLVNAISSLFPEQPISEAVAGTREAYVACLMERIAERPASFDEVKEKVRQDYTREKSVSLAREKARNAALKITESSGAGKTASAAAENAVLKLEDIPEFSLSNPPSGKDAFLMVKLAVDTKAGKISAVENTEDGAVFVIVEKKESPGEAEFLENKAAFTETYRMQKSQLAWMNFMAHLYSRSKVAARSKEE